MEQLHSPYIEELLNLYKPKTLLEIGLLEGKHTLKLLKWCKGNNSVLVSIDPCKWVGNIPTKYLLGASNYKYRRGSKKEKEAIKPIYIEEIFTLGLEKYWHCYKTLSLEYLKKNDMDFDFVFIDGDHNYYTVLHELNLMIKMLNKDGLIFIHDVTNESCKRKDFYYDKFTIPDNFVNGQKQGILTAIEDFLHQNPKYCFDILAKEKNGLGVIYHDR